MISLEFLVLANLTGVKWNLRVILICLSPMLKISICVSEPLDISQFKMLYLYLYPFLIEFTDSLESNFLSSFCMLDITLQ